MMTEPQKTFLEYDPLLRLSTRLDDLYLEMYNQYAEMVKKEEKNE